MIVTFLALLELIRLKRVRVYQRGMFGPIRVFRPVGPRRGRARPAASVAGGKRWTDGREGRREGEAAERAAAAAGRRAAVGARGLAARADGRRAGRRGRGAGGRARGAAAARLPTAGPQAEEASVLPPPQMRAVARGARSSPRRSRSPRGRSPGSCRASRRRTGSAQLEELRADYARDERGLQLVEVAGGYQITTRPEYNDWVRELLDPRTPTRLSIQALETLAVIAYKQPVTLPEIIELRGVKSGGVVKTLLEKRLIRITGRKEVVGRPMLYGTTKQFLLHFGLKDLDELPKIEEFAEVLGEEVDVAGLKRAIESPLPVQVGLSDPDGEQIPLFEPPPAESGGPEGGTGEEPAGPPDDEPTEA